MRGEKVASAQDFVGNQRERTTLGRGFLFLVYLVTILYCSDIVRSKDLSAHFFCFLPILDREFSFLPLFHWEFSFCFVSSPFLGLGILSSFFVSSPFLGLGIFLLFVFSSEGKD